VLELSLRQHIPVAITLAGGYAYDVKDTVTIHCNTAYQADAAIHEVGWRPRA